MNGVGRSGRVFLLSMFATSAGLLAHGEHADAQTTAESLRGRSVQATVTYQQRIRREGRGEFDVAVTVDWRLTISGDGRVTGSATRSSNGPRGPVSTTRQFSAVLGRPREIAGSGHSVMLMSGNTLTLLRTFEVGGNKTTITFSGGGCSIRAPMMQEAGAGPIKRDAIVGGTVEILSSRQVSTSCRLG